MISHPLSAGELYKLQLAIIQIFTLYFFFYKEFIKD